MKWLDRSHQGVYLILSLGNRFAELFGAHLKKYSIKVQFHDAVQAKKVIMCFEDSVVWSTSISLRVKRLVNKYTIFSVRLTWTAEQITI